jgi:hypothetical protein
LSRLALLMLLSHYRRRSTHFSFFSFFNLPLGALFEFFSGNFEISKAIIKEVGQQT